MNESDFYAAMRSAPGDDLVRLAYADWLDERADPKAEFVRLSVQLSKLHPLDADYPLIKTLTEHAFREHVRPRQGEWKSRALGYWRGMTLCRMTARELLACDGVLPEDAFGLELTDLDALADAQRQLPGLERVGALAIHPREVNEADLRALLQSSGWEALHSLSFDWLTGRADVLSSLVAGEFPSLRRLHMRQTPSDEDITALCASDLLRRRLTHLSCSGLEGRRVHARNLRSLVRWMSRVGDSSAPFAGWELPNLRQVSAGYLPTALLNHLLQRLPSIATLDDWGVADDEDTALRLPDSLKRLHLKFEYGPGYLDHGEWTIGAAATERVAGVDIHCDHYDISSTPTLEKISRWPNLRTLELGGGVVTEDGWEVMNDPARFGALKRLDCFDVFIDEDWMPPPNDNSLPALRSLSLNWNMDEGDGLIPEHSEFFRLNRLTHYDGRGFEIGESETLPELLAWWAFLGTDGVRQEHVPNAVIVTGAQYHSPFYL